MTERKQDAWRAVINFKNDSGQNIFPLRREAVLELPRPMSPFDAVHEALAVLVRESRDPAPLEILVSVWGRSDDGSDFRYLCAAQARRIEEPGRSERYVRMTPWLDRGPERSYEEIKAPEGAEIRTVEV